MPWLTGPAWTASDDDGPYVLEEGSFVCVSPEAYGQAIERAESAKSRFKLAKELTKEKLCIMVDEEDIEDMMAPFVLVTEEKGDLIKVQYEVEFYKRIAYLNRAFARLIFAGWTHRDNMMLRADLGKKIVRRWAAVAAGRVSGQRGRCASRRHSRSCDHRERSPLPPELADAVGEGDRLVIRMYHPDEGIEKDLKYWILDEFAFPQDFRRRADGEHGWQGPLGQLRGRGVHGPRPRCPGHHA